MRATVEGPTQKSNEPLSLEAEAAAWRNKRAGTPETVAGNVSVVRIRRRARPTSWHKPSVDRPLTTAPR